MYHGHNLYSLIMYALDIHQGQMPLRHYIPWTLYHIDLFPQKNTI